LQFGINFFLVLTYYYIVNEICLVLEMTFNRFKASLVVLLIWAAIPSSVSAYSLKTTSSGKHILWSTKKVIIRIAPDVRSIFGEEDAFVAATRASEAWRGYANVPELSVESGDPDESTGDQVAPIVGIRVGSPWPYKPNNLAVTVTTYNEVSGQILKADVLINGASHFELFDQEREHFFTRRYDIEAVLTHEFGHLLGLQDNNADSTTTMWPVIEPGETSKRSLEEDDQKGVIAAYANGLAPDVDYPTPAINCQNMSVTRFHSRVPGLDLVAFSLAIIWLARRRRVRSMKA
jgi:Matrixin